jgi:uncharacterized protein with ATP-grasp and redox domains
MKTYLDCIPCFFKQALEASRIAGARESAQKKILNAVAKAFLQFPLTLSPPEMGREIYQIVNTVVNNDDPYKKIKEKSTRLALSVYDDLLKKVAHSKDRLLTATQLAIAGNIIDYGIKNSLNVEEELKKIMREERNAIKHENKRLFAYNAFRKTVNKAKTIVYLGDNAGETVFDRILIEEIKRIDGFKRIIYAVKEKPVINDALEKDAIRAGIGTVAEIISSGSDAPGTVLSLCSKEFLTMYRQADMVISKGQGNFEALSNAKRTIFFLFMAKCPVIAHDVRCAVGDTILMHKKQRKTQRSS